MATLSTLQTELKYILGTDSLQRFNTDAQTWALNRARKALLNKYNIEDFLVEATISFTSGVGTLPTDYLKCLLNPRRSLYNSSNDTEYTKVDHDRFDDDQANTWTIKDLSGTKTVYIFEADTVSLTLRYIKDPTDMSASGDDNGLMEIYTEAHALLAAYYLLFTDRQYEQAENFIRVAEREIDAARANAHEQRGVTADSSFAQGLLIDELRL